MGVSCGGAAVALGMTPAVGLVAAACAAVIRVLDGDSPAALTAAVVAPVLALASFADAGGELTRTAIALAAVGWTVTELARQVDPTEDALRRADNAGRSGATSREPALATPSPSLRPLVAVLAAVVAAVLDPAFVVLVAIAGARLVTLTPRPRWVVGVPIAGVVAILVAALAGTVWTGLGARWFGAAAHPASVAALAQAAAAALGPVMAVAALAGIAALARPRYAELALGAAIGGAILVDLRAGVVGLASVGLAAVLAGLAVGRLAALIRLPSGQAVTGAVAGLLVILPPAWTAFERQTQRGHSAHFGHSAHAGHPGAHTGYGSR
jgi:hypothetical protein